MLLALVVGGASLLLIAAIWLISQNYDSESLKSNAITAVVVGVVGLLATLWFSLKPPAERDERFPVVFVIEKQTRLPLSVPQFPAAAAQYADPVSRTPAAGVAAMYLQGLVSQVLPSIPADDNAAAQEVYLGVLGTYVVGIMGHVFHTGWDAEIFRFETAYHASSEYGARSPSRAGITISSREIVKDLPHAAVAGDINPFWEKFVVPPNTKVERWKPNGIGVVLEMSNPFVTLSVTIDRDAWGIGCGSLALLAGMGLEESQERTFTVSYRVRLRATFERLRSGHPDMPVYERWVSTLFGQLRLLDAEQRWRAIKQDYAFQRDQDAWFQEQLARSARSAKDAGKRTAP